MESFDRSLKYLLQQEPADFIRFALGHGAVRIVSTLASGLPSRARDVDGGYLVDVDGDRLVVHVEFHRRHQSIEELAVDIAEAQIRFYRRERLKVLSLVWDLYGAMDEPVVERRTLDYGASRKGSGSCAAYLRVNLRGLAWDELLTHGPPTLWPLVALARDGASQAAVHSARDAIEARADLTEGQRADHLAVLWFVAEAEDLPVELMRALITEDKLMESQLWQSAKNRGRAEVYGETIIAILSHRLGALDPALREHIRGVSDLDTLMPWYQEALLVVDAEGANRLADKIRKALLP